MATHYLERILQAHVYDVARETPIDDALSLSARLDQHVLIKREDLQPVFTFKLRGAYNRIAKLSPAERERGVICASAGNHAQGVALAARTLKIRSVIVMPKTTPAIKVKAVRALGGKAVLFGDSFDESLAHALELGKQDGMTFVHPYDDPDVIAGQGTIGLEILRQLNGKLDAVFLPVGGGGLAAGVSALLKSVRPDIRVIAVEPEDSCCLKAALESNRRVTLPEVGLFADGVAVRQIGKEPFSLLRQYVDETITVSADEICAAIKDTFEDTRAIAEPAGALALAGLKKWSYQQTRKNQSLLAVLSGANINFDRLRHVSERAELGERREAILAVTIPEQPGAFKAFCQALGRRAVTEFNYRYNGSEEAIIFVGIQIKGQEELDEVIALLEGKGYEVADMTDNEVAKLHIRHLVGGHAHEDSAAERFYCTEFPERPGALLKFLSVLGKTFNISLFHYRNHGAAHGRVLVGFQVPRGDMAKLREKLAKLPYPCVEETDNPACRLFLR